MSQRHEQRLRSRKAIFLTFVMLLASWSVALAGVPLASAHEAEDVISWPLSGSNDTGWVQLDALVGSDPILSSQATADWILEFAPGAEISNVTLQVHVNGSDGLMIDQFGSAIRPVFKSISQHVLIGFVAPLYRFWSVSDGRKAKPGFVVAAVSHWFA